MKRGLILLLIYFLFVSVAFAQTVKKWDRGANTDNWNDAANWNPDGVPGSNDEVVLDNTYVSGDYSVYLPGGNTTVQIRKLEISPASGRSIYLTLPHTNTANPGLMVGDNISGNYDIVLKDGAFLHNLSSASSGSGVALGVGDSLRIENGGVYAHQAIRDHESLVDALSRAPGTENGVFMFSIGGSGTYAVASSGKTYGYLYLSGLRTYTITGSSNLVVRGNFYIGSDATLSSDMTGDFVFRGSHWLNYGTFTTSTQKVKFQGTGVQQITGQTTFYKLEIDNQSGVTISAGIHVTDELIFTSGVIEPFMPFFGGVSLKVSGGISGAGAGKFVRYMPLIMPVSSTGSKKWDLGYGNDYLPLTINFTSLNGSGDVEVRVYDRTSFLGPQPGDAVGVGSNLVLNRWYYVYKSSGITNFTGNFTLSYTDADVSDQGISDENSLRVFMWDGTQWQELSVTSRNTVNNTITVSNVNVNTPYVHLVISGTGDTPLPVSLKSFVAKAVGNRVQLMIETETEDRGFSGFNVYRKQEGEEFRMVATYVNDVNLKAKGEEAFGARYKWEDNSVESGKRYYYKIGAVGLLGERLIDKVVEIVAGEVPSSFVLYQNYPNPFNPTTTIEFGIPVDCDVKFELFNLRGERVAELINKRLEAGYYSVEVDFSGMPSGIYFYRLRANNFVSVKKMVLMK
ncbi:MAG: T9SS type A sorting domain-containing protein [Candidatus Kryptonium sp.]|nr:T9SS type A sorting domain-containing protein [Candidatus Kryptonium sp.]